MAKAILFYVQDVRYVTVPWMARSDACTGCTVCHGAMDGKE
ncbi:MAG: hypothetical protein RQ982_01385 [Gammaproteobacteria bacterium]|nr:hypothetical protein [Gammaproteobacteria bacterium]